MSVLQLPCLGSPYKLGMLYDCRTNKVIPGMTLWSSETLGKFSSTIPQENSMFEINSEDSFKQKAFQLEAGADLQLGLLSGLVQVEGAAKFLYDHKKSNSISRVTLSYKSTTTYEQLTMDHLGKVEFAEVFEKNIATHVVTGVVYGADAFFVFDQEVGKDQDIKQIQGNIRLKIKNLLPHIGMSIEAEGSASLTAKDTCDESKLTCRYYGDTALSSYPTTFQEAIKVCQELPKLIKGKSVAKKVYLLPLADLDSNSQRFVREVGNLLFRKIQDLLEFIDEVEVKINDLIHSEPSSCFTGINKQLNHIKKLVDTYKLSVTTQTATLLPQIRAGKVPESELEKLLKENSHSPFGQECLSSLINEKETEIRYLEQFLNFLKQKEHIIFAFKDGEFDTIFNINDAHDVVCFDFNIDWGNGASLNKMAAYLKGEKVTQKLSGHAREPWYTGHALKTIRKQIGLFAGHVEANHGRQGMKYVATNGQSQPAKQARDKVAFISLYCDPSSSAQFEPLGPPGKPRVEKVNSNSIQLVWEASKQGSTNITGYSVYCYSQPNQLFLMEQIVNKHNIQTVRATVSNLIPSTIYHFVVMAKNSTGRSPYSLQSESIKTKPPVALKEKYLPHCKKIAEGNPKVYSLCTHTTFESELIHKKYALAPCSTGPNKVVMLVGATGAGKTTLINAMANYILGVTWEDDYRFKLITEKTSDDQTESQTKVITAYTFNNEEGFPFSYSLTVIDTPGFGDTEGLERDKKITAQIKEFFCSKNGIDQLHAVGFVVQSAQARLTPTQKYVFSAILSIFGKDIGKSIFLMTTFADGEEPQVLEALKKAEVPFESYFEFNNSCLFANQTKKVKFHAPFWDMGIESFQCFFNAMCKLEALSLKLTQEVLTERQHLEVCLEGLGPQIQAGLNERSKLEKTIHQLEQQEADMHANEEYTITVPAIKQREIPLEGGLFTSTCMQCNYTCHLNCTLSDESKYKCASMTWLTRKENTTCTVCPGKCSWTVHESKPYRYEFYESEETQTLKEILDRYQVAESSRNQSADLIYKINKRISEIDDIIEQMLQKARYSLCRLQEIALRPNPMTQKEYIEMLIEVQKQECKPGWEDRVKGLEDAKKKASMITQVEKGDVAAFYSGATRPIDDPRGKSCFNAKAHGALEWVGKQVDKLV